MGFMQDFINYNMKNIQILYRREDNLVLKYI